jgi:2-polyprenyl-6-methoxyphenol hydroxylase-like FAD-dependent oxidoreductase
MSPIGGVGINLAIQDAVAAANLLAEPLRTGRLATGDLRRVQRRREWQVRLIQRMQIVIQNRLISRILGSEERFSPPLPVRLLARFPLLSRIPARVIGLGFRPEHIGTPDTQPH